ncbi:MAG: efflux RND transporter permease subunit [Elusimicrobia bacterium]|nr:efflux RND transporter permease subunit [Elusimicrobiota bacterium]
MRALLKYCVERPLGVLAVYAGLAVIGLFAWRSLPQELMPDLRYPQLSVVTLLPNASPEEVENLVTKPIEQILGTVKNVRGVESFSKEQVSLVNIQFRWDTDMDAALLWVQEKLGLVQDSLPLEAKKPEVTRYNPFERPVVLIAVTGALPAEDLDHLVESRVRPTLEKTLGVSGIEVSGGLEREVRVDLDAQQLLAHRLTLQDVADALKRRNVSRSAGSAVEGLFEYPITVTGAYDQIKAIAETVVQTEGAAGRPGEGGLLRLSSVGQVKDGFREKTSHARYDGRDNIAVAVYKRAEAYPLDVARDVREALGDLRRQLPGDVHLDVIYDQSVFIREGISDVFGNVVVGGLLAYFILWAFLRSHRRSIIVGLTIPLALLLTVAVFWKLDMTLNLLTLGGLALGVGMLVDAAVVIIENISRHRDMGKSLKDSILDGGEEVGGAVTFSVLTILAAFAPIPFAAVGVAQKVFTPIAVAVMLSHAMSLVVGFTFVPAIGILFLESAGGRRWIPEGGRVFLRGLSAAWIKRWTPLRERIHRTAVYRWPWKRWATRPGQWYESALQFAVRHPRRTVEIAFLCTLANGAGLFLIRRESMPDVDQNQIVMRVTLPAGTRLEVTDRVMGSIEKILAALPEIAHRNVIVGSSGGNLLGALGPNEGRAVIDLADRVKDADGDLHRRRRSARAVVAAAAASLKQMDLEGARVDFEAQGGDVFSQVFGRAGADLVVEVRGTDFEGLKKAARDVQEKMRALPGVAKVDNSLAVPSLQLRYEMDEARLARDGLAVADVAESVLGGVNGLTPTAFRENAKEIPVRLRLREEDRKDAAALERLVVPSPLEKGGSHPLNEYGRLSIAPGPSEIRRRDQRRTVLLSVFFSPGGGEKGLAAVRNIINRFPRKGDVSVALGAEVGEVQASLNSLLVGGVAAIGLVYIVLVAQFNVLWLPLLALVSVPLAINGVTPALLLLGNTLNLMSGQGLMVLSGIVVNNSILLLEFIQQRRAAGMSVEEAVLGASRTRLRPILMTAGTTVIGLLPLALGIGAGAKLQAPMAITVIFGLLVSTGLTLIVLPALYLEARHYFEKPTETERV